MKIPFAKLSVLLAATVLAAPAASAQPGDPDEGGEDPVVDPEPAPAPPPPPPPPPPEPEPIDAEPEPEPAADADDGGNANRPDEFSVGFGVGWNFPANLQIPDTTSVRFRFPSGLIIEPSVELSQLSQEVGLADVDTTTIAAAAAVRYPLLRSSFMDLVGIGGAALAVTTVDPDGGASDTTTQIALFYGIGVDLWVRRHWSVSFQTLNPVISITRGDSIDGSTLIGAIFEPDVLVLIHLFFD
jgi:hypothetical protein